jgi:hypothetical protein
MDSTTLSLVVMGSAATGCLVYSAVSNLFQMMDRVISTVEDFNTNMEQYNENITDQLDRSERYEQYFGIFADKCCDVFVDYLKNRTGCNAFRQDAECCAPPSTPEEHNSTRYGTNLPEEKQENKYVPPEENTNSAYCTNLPENKCVSSDKEEKNKPLPVKSCWLCHLPPVSETPLETTATEDGDAEDSGEEDYEESENTGQTSSI